MVADALLANLVEIGERHARLNHLGHLGQGNSHHVRARFELLELGHRLVFHSSEHRIIVLLFD